MAQIQIEEKRIGALCLCALGTLGILFLCRGQWILSFCSCAAGVLLLAFGEPVKAGSTVEKTFAYTVLLWNVFLMGKFAREISSINGVDSPLPGILLLILCCYGVRKRDILSVSAVIALAMTGIMGVLFLFSIPEVKAERIFSQNSGDITVIPLGFFPTILLYICRNREKNIMIRRAGIGLCLLLGIGLITVGLGAEDFYVASKSVNLLGTMERLEPFVASLATAGGFCLIGSLFFVNQKIREGRKNKKEFKPYMAEFLVATLVCVLSHRIPVRMWALGTTVCWGVIPVIQQGIVVCKKVAKKSQKFQKSA